MTLLRSVILNNASLAVLGLNVRPTRAAAATRNTAAERTSRDVLDVVAVCLLAGQLAVRACALHDRLHAFRCALGDRATRRTRRHALDQLLAGAAAQHTRRGQCFGCGVHQARRNAPTDRAQCVALRQLLACFRRIFRSAREADACLLRDVQCRRGSDHASTLQRRLPNRLLGRAFRHHLGDLLADRLLDERARNRTGHRATDATGQVARTRNRRTRRATYQCTGTRRRKGLQRLSAEVAKRIAGPIREARFAFKRTLEPGLTL